MNRTNSSVLFNHKRSGQLRQFIQGNSALMNHINPQPDHKHHKNSMLITNQQRSFRNITSANNSPNKTLFESPSKNALNPNLLFPKKSPQKDGDFHNKFRRLQEKISHLHKEKQQLTIRNYQLLERCQELEKYNIQLMKQISQVNMEFLKATKQNKYLQIENLKPRKISSSQTSFACDATNLINDCSQRDLSQLQSKLEEQQKNNNALEQKIIQIETMFQLTKESYEKEITEIQNNNKQIVWEFQQKLKENKQRIENLERQCYRLGTQVNWYRSQLINKEEEYAEKIINMQQQIKAKCTTGLEVSNKLDHCQAIKQDYGQQIDTEQPKQCPKCKDLLKNLMKINSKISLSSNTSETSVGLRIN